MKAADEAFVLRIPSAGRAHSGVIRISSAHHLLLNLLSEKTGLPVGKIAEQCIDFALSHRVETKEE